MTKISSLSWRIVQALMLSVLLDKNIAAAELRLDFDIRDPAGLAPELSAYNTELFNLLLDRKSVSGDNRFNERFSKSFDQLLLGSKTVRDKSKLVFLRKRLISGPEPKPVFLSADGRRYFYYEACQAHACDETNLALLYDVESRSMRANLVVEGASELLGNPSRSEARLLDQLKSSR